MDIPFEELRSAVAAHPHPVLFATLSGAHLYGFPSPDSDFDLRGAHILPAPSFGLLTDPVETIARSEREGGLDLDFVTHDIRKFFRLLLKANGYVLEQVLSPLVVFAMPEHPELCEIARRGITRHYAHHYAGFARAQKKLYDSESPRRVKPLLYIYRVLLTGIHLMRTGELNANLVQLNRVFELPYIDELIERKTLGENTDLGAADVGLHDREYQRLYGQLERAREQTHLPDTVESRPELEALIHRLRS
jgi:hypothetical protein